ncbi:MAG: ester cyclase [Chloroflexota bacterium]
MSLYEKAQRFFTLMNAHKLDEMVAMLSPTCETRTPQGNFTGREAYKQWIGGLLRAVPDLTHELKGIEVESGDTLAFELHAFGTMTGPLETPFGEIPPTGRTMDVGGTDFWRFDENGLVAQYHLSFDQAEFMRQLGLGQPS